MTTPEINLLVIRSADLLRSVGFYGLIGLEFTEEKHGNGPIHYSTILGSLVLEIYPIKDRTAFSAVRIGFTVDSIDEVLNSIHDDSIVQVASNTDRGRVAVIEDPDGNAIELVERRTE